VTPYATGKIAGERRFNFDYLFIPSQDIFTAWNALAHEVLGYLVYAVMGYL